MEVVKKFEDIEQIISGLIEEGPITGLDFIKLQEKVQELKSLVIIDTDANYAEATKGISRYTSNIPGTCPKCGSCDITYGDSYVGDGADFCYEYECDDCGDQGIEFYEMEFSITISNSDKEEEE